jgi:hypothetical protein
MPDTTTQTICTPRTSSSQNAVSATMYRQAEHASTANSTDTRNSTYVTGLVGTYRSNANSPTTTGTTNLVTIACPARPTSLAMNCAIRSTGRSRSDTTSPDRTRSGSSCWPQ